MLYQTYINEVQRNVKSNAKYFWRFVNEKRKNTGVPTNVRYRSRVSNNASEAAKLFAKYFRSVYTESSGGMEGNNDGGEPVFNISMHELRRKIHSLDATKGAGPDGLSNRLIKSCAAFETPIYLLFNRSLSRGYFPTPWKCSSITPIWKSGSRLNVENYRGIAIMSAIPKMYEALMFDHLYELFIPRAHDSQHGFLKGRSTITNLAEFSSRVTEWMLCGYQVDAVYTDLSKAFDKINISSLLCALRGNCL